MDNFQYWARLFCYYHTWPKDLYAYIVYYI